MQRPSLALPRLAVLLSVCAWILVATAAPLHAQATDEDVRRIGRQLSCPVCEGQTVADSNAGLAQEMRAVIRLQLDQGRSDSEILVNFVEAYGPGILTDPPKSGASLGVWVAPVAAAMLGAVVLALLLARWVRRTGGGRAYSVGAAATVDPGVLEELSRFRRGQASGGGR